MQKSGMTVHSNSFHNPDYIEDTGYVVFESGSTLTLDSIGCITPVTSFHHLNTYESAATDDLWKCYGGVPGQVLVLKTLQTSRAVVCKDNTYLVLAGDFNLSNNDDTITLMCLSEDVWMELSRSDNA